MSGLRAGMSTISSTSCEACQKNRYGLMVVPRMATTIVHMCDCVLKLGMKKPRTASAQGMCTTTRVPK
jgi:hypothetical protein